MIREFDIEILDNYLTRARAFRLKKGNIPLFRSQIPV